VYLFQPEKLHAIAQEAAGKSPAEAFAHIQTRLEQSWPGRIHANKPWIFNTASGAMGQLKLLYASLSEYIIFFGTPIGTEGHSGRYFAEVHDFMIHGEMWTYFEGDLEKTVYLPGDWAVLPARRAKGYRAHEDTWMLEYARGPIPLMLPTGSLDNLFSNLDLRSMFRMYWEYGKMAVGELMRGKI
jgi:C-8 sterol isomerase